MNKNEFVACVKGLEVGQETEFNKDDCPLKKILLWFELSKIGHEFLVVDYAEKITVRRRDPEAAIGGSI